MHSTFTFDDETHDVLTASTILTRKGGRPPKSNEQKRKKHVSCYLTEAEHQQLLIAVGDGAVSTFVRYAVLEKAQVTAHEFLHGK